MSDNEMHIDTARKQLHDIATTAERSDTITYLVDDDGNQLAAIVHHGVGEAWERIQDEEDQVWGEYALRVSQAIERGEVTTVPFESGSTYDVDNDKE